MPVHTRSSVAAEQTIAHHMQAILGALGIAPSEHTAETPSRVAKMLVHEVCAGYFVPRPTLTDFANAPALDQIYCVGPIAIRSCCAHHLVPILGHAWVGVLPSERIIGLSKFHRLADWVMARPQIQEQGTVELANEIEAAIAPTGLALVLRARHFCTAWRGVRDEPSVMTTSVMRGAFRDNPEARAEFMALIAGMGYR